MLLLYIAVTVGYLWVGFRIGREGWRILRKARHHHMPFQAAACGALFLSLGVLNCTWVPYQLNKGWWV